MIDLNSLKKLHRQHVMLNCEVFQIDQVICLCNESTYPEISWRIAQMFSRSDVYMDSQQEMTRGAAHEVRALTAQQTDAWCVTGVRY